MRFLSKRSLAERLFFLSALSLIITLFATGFLLTSLYFNAVERSFDSVIDINMDTLIAQIAESGNPGGDNLKLVDSRYDVALSGWYWIVRDADKKVLNTSASFFSSTVPELSAPYSQNNVRRGNVIDAENVNLRLSDKLFELPDGKRISVIVTGNFDQLLDQVEQFRSQALIVLAMIALLLALMISIIMRFGLKPINTLRDAIEDVRSGNAKKVTGHYPNELAPLAYEMNNLIEANSKIVERARSQVGNLAHALKTPLAVIQNEMQVTHKASQESLKNLQAKVQDQTRIMHDQVTYYLERARMATRSSMIGKITPADQFLERMVKAMRLIHREKNIQIHDEIEPGLVFRGESQDFDDVLGNLLDNACKWCESQVWVRASKITQDKQPKLFIIIDDDGPGIDDEMKKTALKRGQRLDEKKAGTGLGLDIISELIEFYGGEIHLHKLPRAGLRAEVILPSV